MTLAGVARVRAYTALHSTVATAFGQWPIARGVSLGSTCTGVCGWPVRSVRRGTFVVCASVKLAAKAARLLGCCRCWSVFACIGGHHNCYAGSFD